MTNFQELENDKIIKLIRENRNNTKVYLVGGCVRDFILNRENFDKDIAIISDNPKKFSTNLAEKLDATFIELDSENKIYRLVLKDKINYIDIAAVLSENIEEDLKRRDITINSLAIDLDDFSLIDVTDGLNDLKNGIIRNIQEKNITDDYIRILRIFRFHSTFGFKIDENLYPLIKKYYKHLKTCSIERINAEIIKLFGGKYCDKTILEMDKFGLAEYLFPVFEEVKKIPPNSHHHLPLFLHLVETVKQIQILYQNSTDEIKEHLDKSDFGGASRLAHLKLAAFLHDIGKPQTWTIEEDTGRHRFIKHDLIGANLCEKILKQNKFSKKQISYISTMVKQHIYPSQVVSAPELNDKIFMRFVRKMEANSIDVIYLAMADRLSARGEAVSQEMVDNNINNLTKLLEFYLSVRKTLQPLPKLLNGKEIMELLNLNPSPKLGEIIDSLTTAQQDGIIITREQAIDYIRNIKL